MVCQFCLEIYAEMMFLLFEISFKLHKDKLYANLHQVAYSALNIFVFGHEIKGYRKRGDGSCTQFIKWDVVKGFSQSGLWNGN